MVQLVQVKNSFDPITRKKIIKGFLLGLSSGMTAGVACYISNDNIKYSLLMFMTGFVSSTINGVLEYMKGIPSSDIPSDQNNEEV